MTSFNQLRIVLYFSYHSYEFVHHIEKGINPLLQFCSVQLCKKTFGGKTMKVKNNSFAWPKSEL